MVKKMLEVVVKYLYPAFTKVKILAFTVYSSLSRVCRSCSSGLPLRLLLRVSETLFTFGFEVLVLNCSNDSFPPKICLDYTYTCYYIQIKNWCHVRTALPRVYSQACCSQCPVETGLGMGLSKGCDTTQSRCGDKNESASCLGWVVPLVLLFHFALFKNVITHPILKKRAIHFLHRRKSTRVFGVFFFSTR